MDESMAHCAPRPLKIACLHGFRQNAQRFRQKTGALRKSLERDINLLRPKRDQSANSHDLAELIYIDAPYILEKVATNDDSQTASDQDKRPILERAVFSPNLVVERPANGAGSGKKAIDVTQRTWWTVEGRAYSGWERSCDFLRATFAEKKFDGVLGFSQGAIVVSLICAMRAHEPDTEFASLRFAIMMSGFPSRADAHQHLYQKPIEIPSLHVWGARDEMIPPRGPRTLLQCFDPNTRKELEHKNGHIVPGDAASRTAICDFLLDFASGTDDATIDRPRAAL